jgi:hypothetical protein
MPHVRPIVLLLPVWILTVAIGWTLVTRYEVSPTPSASAPEIWPTIEVEAPEDRPTLLVFIHPRCPCTRATVSELARLVARVPDAFALRAVFVCPPGTEPRWAETFTWHEAGRIPGVERILDQDGVLARAFDARVSGGTLLYDVDGALLFEGGITGSRGHEGANLGRLTLEEIGLGRHPDVSPTPVFGCPLLGPDSSTEHTCEPGSEVSHVG